MTAEQVKAFEGFTVKIGRLEGEMLIADIKAEDDVTAPEIEVESVAEEYNERDALSYDVTVVYTEEALDENGKLKIGEWKIKFTAEDPLGNRAETKAYDITVKDATAPVITIGGETEFEAGSAYDTGALPKGVTVTITDNYDGAITEYTVEYPENAVKDGKLQVGTWKITVKASDKAGNKDEQSVAITVKDTVAPVITVDEKKTVTEYKEGDELNIVASASDSYDGSVDISLEIPDGAVKDGKLVKGEWTIKITAKDSSGNVSDAVTVQINVEGVKSGCGCNSLSTARSA